MDFLKKGSLFLFIFLLISLPLIFAIDESFLPSSSPVNTGSSASSGPSDLSSGSLVSIDTSGSDIVSKVGGFFKGAYDKVSSWVGGIGSSSKQTQSSMQSARAAVLTELNKNAASWIDSAQYGGPSPADKVLTELIDKYKYTIFNSEERAKLKRYTTDGWDVDGTTGAEIKEMLKTSAVPDSAAGGTTNLDNLEGSAIDKAIKDYRSDWDNSEYGESDSTGFGMELKRFVDSHKDAFTKDQLDDIEGGVGYVFSEKGVTILAMLEENKANTGWWAGIKNKFSPSKSSDFSVSGILGTNQSWYSKYIYLPILGLMIGFAAWLTAFILKRFDIFKSPWLSAIGCIATLMLIPIIAIGVIFWGLSLYLVPIAFVLFLPAVLSVDQDFLFRLLVFAPLAGVWFALMPNIFIKLFRFIKFLFKKLRKSKMEKGAEKVEKLKEEFEDLESISTDWSSRD